MEANFDLSKLTTFGTNAFAQYFLEITNKQEILDFLAQKEDLPVLILGGGSNILFTQDQKGYVIKNSIQGIDIIKEDENHVWLRVGAGIIWDDLVAHCVERNWAGIENLSLIPGTVGAAPIQNIGAYGIEIKEVFEELEAIQIHDGNVQTFKKEDCQFGYRQSIFKQEYKNKLIITHVSLKLNKHPSFNTSYGAIENKLEEKGIKELTIQAVREVVCEIRSSKLPDPKKIGNSGSFFKNPELPNEEFNRLKSENPNIPNYPVNESTTKVPAGWLIEQCGWKGKTFGDYGVYDKQALVLVSYGQKDGKKIKKLAYEIKDSVYEKFKVIIEPEVNIL